MANVRQDEYVAEAGDIAGIRVVVLPQNEMAFPEDDGITVSPGHVTTMAITQVTVYVAWIHLVSPALCCFTLPRGSLLRTSWSFVASPDLTLFPLPYLLPYLALHELHDPLSYNLLVISLFFTYL